MYKRLATLVAFLFFGVSLVAVASPAHARDMNCSDFDTQAQAQDHLDQQGGGDPDGLDADDDGIACETLPCPCSTGGGGGGGGGGGAEKKKHVIKVFAREIRDTGRFKLYGKVPTYKNGKGIQVMRKLTQGTYKKYKTTRTNGQAKIRKVTFDGPTKTCFKVVVPARGKYRRTEKGIGCIVPG